MKRMLQVIGVRSECLDEYVDLHDHIWPEVAEAIAQAHLQNYSIFYCNGSLMQYMEYTGSDLEGDMARLSQCDAMRRWCAVCRTMQIPDSGQWLDAREVFHQD